MNWVGIDGYYLKPSWKFAPLFGPTIAAVRKLTLDPILIAETGAVPAAGQPAKIADLFAGIRPTGCSGSCGSTPPTTSARHFGLSSPAADRRVPQGRQHVHAGQADEHWAVLTGQLAAEGAEEDYGFRGL